MRPDLSPRAAPRRLPIAKNLPARAAGAHCWRPLGAGRAAADFIAFDEGSATSKIPFLAIGPHVKVGYAGAVSYTHGSIVKSVERILELPILATVSSTNELSDLFVAGFYP